MFLGFTENTDPSLKQGEKFNRMMKVFDKMVDPQLQIIEKGSPKVLEGLENSTSAQDDSKTNTNGRAQLKAIDDSELDKLSNLEMQFDETSAEYSPRL